MANMTTQEILQGIKDWAAPKVIYDISAAHNNTKYTDLADALGTNGGNIPQEYKKGGITVRFVHTSDNKYVQYRLMSNKFNTTVTNWQGVDDEPTAGSDNLVNSKGIYTNESKLVSLIKTKQDLELIIGSISNTGGNIQSTNRVRTPYIKGKCIVYLNDGYKLTNFAGYDSTETFNGHYQNVSTKDIKSYIFDSEDNYIRFAIQKIDNSDFSSSELGNIIKSFVRLNATENIFVGSSSVSFIDTRTVKIETLTIKRASEDNRKNININNTFIFPFIDYIQVLLLDLKTESCRIVTLNEYVSEGYNENVIILLYRTGGITGKYIFGELYSTYINFLQDISENIINGSIPSLYQTDNIPVDKADGNRYVNYTNGEYVGSDNIHNYANEIELNGDELAIGYYCTNFATNPGGYAFFDENHNFIYGIRSSGSYNKEKKIDEVTLKSAIKCGAKYLRLSLHSGVSAPEGIIIYRICNNLIPSESFNMFNESPVKSKVLSKYLSHEEEIIDKITTYCEDIHTLISDVTWLWSATSDNRHAVLVPIMGYGSVKILTQSDPSVQSGVAFLKDDTIQEGETPSYCDGTNYMSLGANQEVLFHIPTDANFLYVRFGSTDERAGKPVSIKVSGKLFTLTSVQTNRNIVIGSPQLYASMARIDDPNFYSVTTLQDVYDALDVLVSSYPTFFTREADLGLDCDGNPIRHYKLYWHSATLCVQDYGEYRSNFTNGQRNNAPEIFMYRRAVITAGVHGAERGSVWGLVYLLQDILASNDSWARFIKANYMLDIIPVICPWNYINKSRENKNGINVNRDYSDKVSEEANVVIDYLDSISDNISCIIDSHTYLGNMGFFGINQSNSEMSTITKVCNELIASMQNEWAENIKDKLPIIDSFKAPYAFVNRSTNAGTLSQVGLNYTPYSITVESVYRSNDNIAVLAKQTADMIGNILQSFLMVMPTFDNLGKLRTYSVTYTRNGNAAAMLQEYPSAVQKGDGLKLSVMAGAKGHENIAITVGGVDVTAIVYNYQTSEINIPFVTGDVVIIINEETLPSGYSAAVISTESDKEIDTGIYGNEQTEMCVLAKPVMESLCHVFGDITNRDKSISCPASNNNGITARFGNQMIDTYPVHNIWSENGYSLLEISGSGVYNQFGKWIEWPNPSSAFTTEGTLYIGRVNGVSAGVAGNSILASTIIKNDAVVFCARSVKRLSDNAFGMWDYISGQFIKYE